jgi:glycyl-tRNA synthetase
MQVNVYPLVNKDGLRERAQEVHSLLLSEGFLADIDDTGSIGRRYARADEAGVSLGITVDYDTLKDSTITVRDRDSWKQVRSALKDLPRLLHAYFQGKINFEDLGTPVSTSS